MKPIDSLPQAIASERGVERDVEPALSSIASESTIRCARDLARGRAADAVGDRRDAG